MATEQEVANAKKETEDLRANGYAVRAKYDVRGKQVLVFLNNGISFGFPPCLAEGLADARSRDLGEIEITPSGLGLHWPRLDADLYLPALLNNTFGSMLWTPKKMGAAGGKARTATKLASARANGLKGGRPRRKTNVA